MRKSFAFVLLLLICSCNTKQENQKPDDSINEAKTKEILDHHFEAFKANDLEETMKDYTDESILITPDKTFKGLAEIRENFVFAFSLFPKDSTTITNNKTVVVSDLAYILWVAKTPKFELTYATDSFIIRDGKIIRQTYAGVAK